MKFRHLLTALICLAWTGARADVNGVTVEVSLEQNQFLPGEDVVAAVRIVNQSGRTLKLGTEEDWLTFSLEARDGSIVRRTGTPEVMGAFSLDTGKAATRRVNLTPSFDFQKPGRYILTAYARGPSMKTPSTSQRQHFDITGGTQLKVVEFGVPGPDNGTPEIRRYILQQATYLTKIKLYLRVTDATGAHTLNVFPISPMLSFSNPEAQLDQYNNLHILMQNGAKAFIYMTVNPDGQILARETYDYTATRPRLKLTDGRITVGGGERRVTPQDLPPPAPSTVGQLHAPAFIS